MAKKDQFELLKSISKNITELNHFSKDDLKNTNFDELYSSFNIMHEGLIYLGMTLNRIKFEIDNPNKS